MDLICGNKSFFKNPNNLPLNELYFDYQKVIRLTKNDHTLEETVERLKSLSFSDEHYRVETVKRPALDKCWIDRKKYECYHRYDLHLPEEQNKGFMKNVTFLDNLRFLNECTYHQFWCYISYEPNIARVVKEFLHNAVPLHLVSHLSRPFLSLHLKIHSCIRDIYQRLLQFKVSIIHEHGLLSPEAVLILCYLYNPNEPQFVSDVIDFCLKKEDIFLRKVNELLKKIVDELDSFTHTSFHNQRVASVVEEKAFFLYEVASTLHQFLSACKFAVDVAFYAELPYCITYVYQKVYAETSELIDRDSNGHDWSNFKDLIKKWLALGKFEFVNLFHVFASYCLDSIINLRQVFNTKLHSTKQDEYVELYIGLISNALDNDLFVMAYDKTYPIREQFETFIDCVTNFDVQQSEYLLQSLNRITSEFSNEPELEICITATPKPEPLFNSKKYESIYQTLSQYLDKPNKKSTQLPRNVSLALEQYYELTKQLSGGDGFGQAVRPEQNEIDACVRAVLDVLPHLERDFVLSCLDEMDYNVNDVITRILSKDLSTTTSRPSTSKKGMYANANEMLNDKKEKESIKQLVLKASYSIDLDDEYDDRYQIGNAMNDSDDGESRIYRHLEEGKEVCDNDSTSSGEEEPAVPQRDTKLDFCADPSIMREMRERKYQNSRRVPSKTVEKTDDKPKHFRNTKPKYNKKSGAQWKRSKGMIPS
ncbi:hypothetical protein RN001_013309 [Aquatica leii]|uniref:CUE domain-containing protein n=1 Tax=Aquatica leii TaxID=1421715 RepID=A0AAN7PQG2_9COLE|nr:hypothetical protein RN001_013309 [Aquatica leii]